VRGLDRDPVLDSRWQNALAVRPRLLCEQLQAGRADDSCPNGEGSQSFLRVERQLHFRAARDEDHVGCLIDRIRKDVCTHGQTDCRSEPLTIDERDCLTREGQSGWTVLAVDRHAPCLDRLSRIRRPDHDQPWHRAKPRKLLDGLMGGSILAEADGIVREHVDDVLPHHRG
jgi:hypothetical protein